MGRDLSSVTDTFGDYEDFREIGRGGFARVYWAWQPVFRREVAIKVLTGSFDAAAIRRFERECVAVGTLSGHPNIVTVYELGTTDGGAPCIVMEYMSGGSLAARLSKEGPLPWPDVVDIGVKLCGAVAAAHDAGVLHGDIKPDNVLFSRFGEPKLADFGVARVRGTGDTIEGVSGGTLAFCPPEVFDGKPRTIASEVYALCASLFALLTGQPPFGSAADGEVAALMRGVLFDPPPDLRGAGIPGELCDVLEQGLSKRRGDRQARPLQLGRQLQAIQSQAGLKVTDVVLEEARPDTSPSVDGAQPTVPASDVTARSAMASATTSIPEPAAAVRTRRRRWPVIVVAVGLLGVGGLGGAIAVHEPSEQQESERPVGTTAPTATTSTSTPLPQAGEVAFRDDFAAPKSGWLQTSDALHSYAYADGKYVMRGVGPPAKLYISTADFKPELSEFADLAVEVDAQPVGDASFGVACRDTPGGTLDAGSFYVATLGGANHGAIQRYARGRWKTLEPPSRATEPRPSGTAPQRVRLECFDLGRDVRLRLLVDGELVNEAKDGQGLPVGHVGVFVAAPAQGEATVVFDNLVITRL